MFIYEVFIYIKNYISRKNSNTHFKSKWWITVSFKFIKLFYKKKRNSFFFFFLQPTLTNTSNEINNENLLKMQTESNIENANFYINVCSSLGLLIAVYSYYVKVKFSKNKKYKAICDISENVSCTKVLSSE